MVLPSQPMAVRQIPVNDIRAGSALAKYILQVGPGLSGLAPADFIHAMRLCKRWNIVGGEPQVLGLLAQPMQASAANEPMAL